MKTKRNLLLASISMVLILSSCKDNDNSICIGGAGGQLTAVAYLKHHGEIIANQPGAPDTVWVRFNALEWPNAPIGYDTVFIGEEGEDHVHVEGLKCGNYFLYASGFDTTYQEVVRGGIPLSTDKTSGEVLVDIPITE
ncbi:MAG: hypothetical protein ACKO1U_05970 [Bacteroidota bacterium]